MKRNEREGPREMTPEMLEKIEQMQMAMAEFMGARREDGYPPNKDTKGKGILFYYPENTSPTIWRHVSYSELRYFYSWDWLMTVIDKLESMDKYIPMGPSFKSMQFLKRLDKSNLDPHPNRTHVFVMAYIVIEQLMKEKTQE